MKNDKSKFKEAMFQYSMLETSVSWWEGQLNVLLTEMERLPPGHPSMPKKRTRIQFILRRLNLEEENIATYFKNNEESS